MTKSGMKFVTAMQRIYKEQYENFKVSKENLETYIDVQNLLGITIDKSGFYEEYYSDSNIGLDAGLIIYILPEKS